MTKRLHFYYFEDMGAYLRNEDNYKNIITIDFKAQTIDIRL
jgi:hypothetical protein